MRLVAFVAIIGSSVTPAFAAGAYAALVASETAKVCQLTGDVDWHSGASTAARTLTNFGLDAVDLGYPVEHQGRLVLMFGDSWPAGHGRGAAGEIPPDDAVGETVRTAAPSAESGCLDLKIHSDGKTPPHFIAAKIVGAPQIKQGFFNVPTGGVSVAGGLYAFFWTGHCSKPAKLIGGGAPLALPAPSADCPETDTRNSLGHSVLALSSDNGETYHGVRQLPAGFVYTEAVNAESVESLPASQRLGIFVFGAPRFRASVPYLALAPEARFGDVSTWSFLAGLSADGTPKWATFSQWSAGAGTTDAPERAWMPPESASIYATDNPGEQCVGEFSVTWNVPLNRWLMLYGCQGSVEARSAPAPWGPWTVPTTLLAKSDFPDCQLMMRASGCGTQRDFWPQGATSGSVVPGGPYAPYVLDRYTTEASGTGARPSASIYWLVSTWNPYEVTVMHTILTAP